MAECGFADIFVRDPQKFSQQVLEYLGDSELRLVLDAIGGQIQKDSYKLLAPMGRLVVFGAAEFTPNKKRPNYLKALVKFIKRPRYDALQMISDNKSVMAFNLIWLWDKIDVLEPMLAEMESHDLRPYVGKEFSFQEAIAAIDWLKSGKSIGKVVLKVNEHDI